jgi:DNA-binding CsgD family transcriptional regulator
LERQTSEKEEVISRIHCLTASEFRVFRMLGLGMTNNEMAESLHVSLYTVRSHMKKIHAKCGVRDRAKLTLIAHQACYREQPESQDEERAAKETNRSSGRCARDQSERRQPELWEPAPASSPVAVDAPTEYFS